MFVAHVECVEEDRFCTLRVRRPETGDDQAVLTSSRGRNLRIGWIDRRTIEVGYDDLADLSCRSTRLSFYGKGKTPGRTIFVRLRPYQGGP